MSALFAFSLGLLVAALAAAVRESRMRRGIQETIREGQGLLAAVESTPGTRPHLVESFAYVKARTYQPNRED